MRKFYISGIVSFCIGLVLLITAVSMLAVGGFEEGVNILNSFNGDVFDENELNTDESFNLVSSNIKNIFVDMNGGVLDIKTDKNASELSAKLFLKGSLKRKLDLSNSSDTLEIKVDTKKNFINIFGHAKLEIVIPYDYFGKLKLETNGCNVNLKDLGNISGLDIYANGANLDGKNANINCGLSLELNAANADIDFSGVSGDIHIDCNAANADLIFPDDSEFEIIKNELNVSDFDSEFKSDRDAEYAVYVEGNASSIKLKSK